MLFGIALYFAFRFCDGFFPSHIKREVASRLQDTRARPWSHVVVDIMDRVLVGERVGRQVEAEVVARNRSVLLVHVGHFFRVVGVQFIRLGNE